MAPCRAAVALAFSLLAVRSALTQDWHARDAQQGSDQLAEQQDVVHRLLQRSADKPSGAKPTAALWVDHVTDLAEQYERAHDAIRRSLSGRKVSTDGPQATAAQQAASDVCLGPKYAPLYAQIEADLAPWRERGITQELMDYAMEVLHQPPLNNKGSGVLFESGRAYVLDNASHIFASSASHHARLIVAHLMLFQSMAERFGPTLPDVEFVFGTADSPYVLKEPFAYDSLTAMTNSTALRRPDALSFISGVSSSSAQLLHKGLGYVPTTPPPIIRFCKADGFADILAPDIHFYMRSFGLANSTLEWARKFPWPVKNNTLFGRFSPYSRASHGLFNSTHKDGVQGKSICRPWRPGIYFCDTRSHFINDFVRPYKQRRKKALERAQAAAAAGGAGGGRLPDDFVRRWPAMDVAQQPKRPMMHHAAQRWLLHLDGQTCSSRLEQLLALGSLVLKEESGFFAFFHHLLKPYEHYLPMWRKDPADVEEALAWAIANDPYYITPGLPDPLPGEAEHAVGLGSSSQQVAGAIAEWRKRSPAARIAGAGASMAARYLSKEAVTCYWFKLLHELAKLQRYQPGVAAGRKYAHGPPTPVPGFLSSKLARHEMALHFSGKQTLDL